MTTHVPDCNAVNGCVLIVDDTPDNLLFLSTVLTKHGYKTYTAQSGARALAAVNEFPIDLILLDVSMPEMNGFDVCKILKATERLREIPVIFISALAETDNKLRGFEVGGVDYVTKPFHFQEILARVHAHVTLFRQRRELDELRQKEIRYFRDLNLTKDQFVSTVSHDLKNPISIIRGYVDLLEQHAEVQGPLAALAIARIRSGADNMLALVTDLLDLARIEAGMSLHRVPVLMNGFLKSCIDAFELQAQNKQITLSYVPTGADVLLSIDKLRLSQVINNLISNAIKFTPAQGRIKVLATLEAARLVIRVEDSGIGIPADDVRRLFDKFYRVDHNDHQDAEGTGLGLSIAKAIVEQHCGDIKVESVPGQGSTFSIYLPLEAEVATSTSTFPVVKV